MEVLRDLPPRVPTSEYPQTINSNFPETQNTNILKQAQRQQSDKIPIWITGQAGRYLPEFLEVRQKHDFFAMCTTPEVACEITLQPLRRFELDCAIIFSDILVVPQSLGMEVQIQPGVGPVLPEPLKTEEDLQRLVIPDYNVAFECYYDAIYLTRHSLQGKIPILGFAGGPFSLMAYMVEGGGSKEFLKTRRWLYERPEACHQLLRTLTTVIIEFLVGQACSGAQILQVYESHVSVLAQREFNTFVLPYIREIAEQVKERLGDNKVPMIIFPKGYHYLESVMQLQFDVVGIDWTTGIREAAELAEKYGKAIQGNLDPAILYSSEETIRTLANDMMSQMPQVGYIANIGFGMNPDTPIAGVHAYIDTVHNFRQQQK